MRTAVKKLITLIAQSFLVIAAAGCYSIGNVPTQHIVMVDSVGRLVDPTGTRNCTKKRPTHSATETAAERTWNGATEQISYEVPLPSSYSWTPCNGSYSQFGLRDLDRVDESANGCGECALLEGDRYISDVLAEMDRYFASRPDDAVRRVVFVIHGGLNNTRSTIERAKRLAAAIRADGAYPVFLNWHSNLPGALWEHLIYVRQGDHKSLRHSFLAPAYLAGDLAKGIGRAPALWFYGAGNDIDRMRKRFTHQTWSQADQTYCRLRSEYEECLARGTVDCETFAISKGPLAHRYTEGAKASAKGLATGTVPVRAFLAAAGGPALTPLSYLPLKYIVAPFLDGLGTPAWDTMLRHAVLPFHADGVPNAVNPDELDPTKRLPQGRGGYSRFFTAFERHMAQRPGHKWELTLIGHSMGAIVTNEILQNFPTIHFDHIVYLAAACSVRDYEAHVFPYLQRHPGSRMHHVTLHDFADLRDQYFKQIPPSGSLLVWIDNFLSKPRTMRDRTAGRFDNLMRFAEETPRHLRRQITIKTFGVGDDLAFTDPQGHGDFNDFRGQRNGEESRAKFWDPSFWEPEKEYRPTRKQRCPAEPLYPPESVRRCDEIDCSSR